mmetsp:Transcript_41657/g.53736  ORF Transcript_41657/g.53736 Transcript_41657/m.53736 type:complete len:295 (+) Transcript_41657:488-1372(+)
MEKKGLKTCGIEATNNKPKIALHFKLDASGIVKLVKAEATCDQPEPTSETTPTESTLSSESPDEGESTKATDKKEDGTEKDVSSKEENGGGNEKEDKEEGDKEEGEGSEDGEPKKDKEEETAEEKKARKKAKKEAKKKEAEKAKKDKKNKEKKDQPFKAELLVVERFTAPELKCLSPEATLESKLKLEYLQELDNERKFKLESKNQLESFLYDVKNRIEDEAVVIDQVSTEEQRDELMEKVRYDIDWLDEDGFDVKGEIYLERKATISELSDPIFFRASELTARPEAVVIDHTM